MLTLLVGLQAPLQADGEAFEHALSSLSAPTAGERVRGERWLAANLKRTDFARLAEVALAGKSEVRVRITRALGANDRHLDLALLLASDQNEELKALGEEAVREIAGRWRTGLGKPMAVDQPDQPELRDAIDRLREAWPAELYRISTAGTLLEVVGQLGRTAELPLFVCVDPFAEDARARGNQSAKILEGTWDQLLLKLAVEFGVNLEGALSPNDKNELLPLFVCYRPRTATSGSPATMVLTEWCLESTETTPLAERASRALAGSGWPAGLLWLDRRFRDNRDEAALEGLLLAASQNRVALSLQRASVVAELLDRADSAKTVEQATSVVNALKTMAPVGLDGVRLDEVLIEGWEALTPRSLRLRLIALEGMTSSSNRVRGAVASLLARPHTALDTELRFQALRTWSAIGDSREVQLAGLDELIAATRDTERADELVLLFLAARVAPNSSWESPAKAAELSLAARAMVLEWHLMFGRTVAAEAYLESLASWKSGWPTDEATREGQAAAAHVLRRMVRRGDGPRVTHWLQNLFTEEQGGPARRSLHRLVILSGAQVPDRALRDMGCFTKLIPEDSLVFPEGEELVLGVLGARPVPAVSNRARTVLIQRFARTLARPDIDPIGTVARAALAGIERCAEELYARGADSDVSLLVSEIHGLLRRFPTHPLAGQIFANNWPLGPSSQPIELSSRDRELR